VSPNLYERLSTVAHDAVTRLNVRSALNPVLWLCGIIVPVSIVGALLSSGTAQIALLALATAPVLVFAGGYTYFMIKDPDKLQSESYQLRKQALELIEEKGTRIPIEMTSVEVISNPDLPQLLPPPAQEDAPEGE
jgi:hypothetical protein